MRGSTCPPEPRASLIYSPPAATLGDPSVPGSGCSRGGPCAREARPLVGGQGINHLSFLEGAETDRNWRGQLFPLRVQENLSLKRRYSHGEMARSSRLRFREACLVGWRGKVSRVHRAESHPGCKLMLKYISLFFLPFLRNNPCCAF